MKTNTLRGLVPTCLAAMFLALAPIRAAQRPNVLFLVIDDLRPELGCYGATYIKSPNIDRLAANGMRFERSYCQQAICGPSRASLLTGLRPDTLKIEDIDTFFRKTVPDVVTLPQLFKQNGYTAVYYGKVFHPMQEDDARSWSPMLPGLRPQTPAQEYLLPESIAIQKQRRAAALQTFGKGFNLAGIAAGPAWEAADAPDSDYIDGRTTNNAIAAMRKLKDKPFFLAVGWHKPHLPFVAPKKYFDLYDPATLPLTDTPDAPLDAPTIARHSSLELRTRAGIPTSGPIDAPLSRNLIHAYAACVSFADAQVGRVLAELDALGLRDNTIIVLWGDNGWHLGEYGIWGKATNYEVATRVPLIVSAPGAAARGKSTRALVEFVDVYPTLCELAGLTPPPNLTGRSFVPLLSKPDLPWKAAAFSQFPSPALREWAARPLSPAMRQTFFGPLMDAVEAKLQQENGARYNQEIFEKYLMGYTMRTDRYRFTIWVDRRALESEPYAVELYDHENDPHERVNIAGRPENHELVAQLRAQWLAAR